MAVEQRRKSPFWAAFWNFLFPGLGYLYVGSKRQFFRVGLLVAYVTTDAVLLFDSSSVWSGVDTLVLLIGQIIAILFAVDAWKDAEDLNESGDGLSSTSS